MRYTGITLKRLEVVRNNLSCTRTGVHLWLERKNKNDRRKGPDDYVLRVIGVEYELLRWVSVNRAGERWKKMPKNFTNLVHLAFIFEV
jgi:hypothetical protein